MILNTILFGLVTGFGFNVAAGVAIAVVFALRLGLYFEGTIQPTDKSPSRSTAKGRAELLAGLVNRLASGLATGVVFGILAGMAFGLPIGLVIGLASGLASGLGGLTPKKIRTVFEGMTPEERAALWRLALGDLLPTAWLRHQLTRFALSRKGYLPWNVMGFLDEAHRRGVLRQTGSVYQFRHDILQQHLADQPAKN